MASCSRIPEAPAAITTLICPPLGRRAANRSSMPFTASSERVAMSSSVSISAPVRQLRETLLFSTVAPCWKMTERDKLAIGRVSKAISPKELNMRISLTVLESMAMTLMIRLSLARTACSSFCRKGTRLLALVCRQSRWTG